MAKQIIIPGHLDVAHRVALLEQRVAALTEAVHVLASALDAPDDAEMARRAHELLPVPLTAARPH